MAPWSLISSSPHGTWHELSIYTCVLHTKLFTGLITWPGHHIEAGGGFHSLLYNLPADGEKRLTQTERKARPRLSSSKPRRSQDCHGQNTTWIFSRHIKITKYWKRAGKRKEIKYSQKPRWDKYPLLIPNSHIVMVPSLFSSCLQGTPFEYYGMQILYIKKPAMNQSWGERKVRLLYVQQKLNKSDANFYLNPHLESRLVSFNPFRVTGRVHNGRR